MLTSNTITPISKNEINVTLTDAEYF